MKATTTILLLALACACVNNDFKPVDGPTSALTYIPADTGGAGSVACAVPASYDRAEIFADACDEPGLYLCDEGEQGGQSLTICCPDDAPGTVCVVYYENDGHQLGVCPANYELFCITG